MDALYWLVTVASLVAVVLNIRRHVACFWIWTGTNASWATIDYAHGLHAQAALQVVYFGLSLWGVWQWSRPEHRSKRTPQGRSETKGDGESASEL